MIEPPMGGIYEAYPAAEPGKSVIFKTVNSVTGSWVLVEYLVHR